MKKTALTLLLLITATLECTKSPFACLSCYGSQQTEPDPTPQEEESDFLRARNQTFKLPSSRNKPLQQQMNVAVKESILIIPFTLHTKASDKYNQMANIQVGSLCINKESTSSALHSSIRTQLHAEAESLRQCMKRHIRESTNRLYAQLEEGFTSKMTEEELDEAIKERLLRIYSIQKVRVTYSVPSMDPNKEYDEITYTLAVI
jgi:hypothetical protein